MSKYLQAPGGGTSTSKITGIYPSLGDTGGAQHVTIFADKGMLAQTTATIGGVAVDDFVAQSDTMASCVTAAGSYTGSAVDVVMGGVTLAAAYENWDPVSYFSTHLKGYWNINVLSSLTFATGISQANDLSGNAHHMIQATGANQPTYTSNDQTFGGAGNGIWPNAANNNTRLEASITLAEPYTIVWFGLVGSAAGDAQWGGNGGAGVAYQTSNANEVVANDTLATTNTKKRYIPDASPMLTVDVRNGASSALYIQNPKSKKAAAVSSDSITALAMGNIVGGGLGLWNGRVVFMMAIDRAVTDAEVEMIAKWAQSFTAPAHPAPDAQLLISGNSFTVGALATDNAVQGFAQTIAAGMPSHIRADVVGESGNTTANMKTGATSLAVAELSLAAKRVCRLQEIGNDIQTGGVDGATAYANVLTWAANMVLAGYLPIVNTEITRAATSGWNGTMETARTTCNASLLSGATPVVGQTGLYLHSSGTFYVADWDGTLTTAQKDPTNATYRVDGVHPTTKLHAILAALELPWIRYVFSTLGVTA